ncbi:MAG: outer membrane beta-barrel protein [Bacteroidota bacterium]
MKTFTRNVYKVILIGAMCFISMSSYSQAFQEGKSSVSAGYGFGNFIQSIFNTYNNYDDFSLRIMGPMFGKYEYAISDNMGIGINFAYAGAKVTYKDNNYTVPNGDVFEESINWTTYSILGRFNVHFGDHDIIDPYWGVGMGYRTAKWEYTNNDPTYVNNASISSIMPFGFETTFGINFMFAPSFGAYAEVGIAKAIFQVGLTGRF